MVDTVSTDTIAVAALALSLISAVAVLALCAWCARATPLRLLQRQSDLESHQEAVQRDVTGMRTSWSQFLTDFEGLAEAIDERMERTETKRKRAQQDRQRAERAVEDEPHEETLDEFDARMRTSMGYVRRQ